MKPVFTKEYLEYEFVVKHFELRDGVLWVKEYVDEIGRVKKTRPAKSLFDSTTGYLRVRAGGKMLYKHRVIFILTHNRPIRKGYQIHHIYNNPLDNRIEHLEEVSHQVNCQNKQVHLGGHLVGTTKTKWGWAAKIRVNSKQYHLGLYDTELEAHLAYMAAYELIEPIPAHIAGQFTPAELRHAVKNILAHNSLKLQETRCSVQFAALRPIAT